MMKTFRYRNPRQGKPHGTYENNAINLYTNNQSTTRKFTPAMVDAQNWKPKFELPARFRWTILFFFKKKKEEKETKKTELASCGSI